MTEEYYMSPGIEAAGPSLMQRTTAILPYARYVPKNPALLIGAAAVGLIGMLAWRNRETIRRTAQPLLQNAADRATALRSKLTERRFGGPAVNTTR